MIYMSNKSHHGKHTFQRMLGILKNDKSHHGKYTFQEVLEVLYDFVATEAKYDEGKILKKMNQTKDDIRLLSKELKSLGYSDNFFSSEGIKEIPKILDFDESEGYSVRGKIVYEKVDQNFVNENSFGEFLKIVYSMLEKNMNDKKNLILVARVTCDIYNLALGNAWFSAYEKQTLT